MGGAMTKVLPGLFVGGLENAKNEEELIANCISHILVIQAAKGEFENQSPSRQYLQAIIPDRDSNRLIRRIPEVNTFIHRARTESGNVLVCSESGISTNVAVVAAYLMTVYGLDRRSAVSAVQGLRHFALPVHSLVSQLDQFDATSDVSTTLHGEDVTGAPNCSTEITSQTISAEVERRRLKDIFGDWPGYEEDLLCLFRAINSFKSMSESGLILRDPCTPPTSRPSSPVSVDIVVSATEGHMTPMPNDATRSSLHLLADSLLEAGSPNVLLTRKKPFLKLTPPSTPPSTPVVAVSDELMGYGGKPLTPQLASTSTSSFPVSTKGVSEAVDCSPPTTLNETDLFPDDAPLLDVDEFASRYCQQIAARCGSLPPAFEVPFKEQSPPPFEIGIELTSDVEDNEDDDVPGAIAIRSPFSNRPTMPRAVAASYHIGVRADHRADGNSTQAQPQTAIFPGMSDRHQHTRRLPDAAIANRLSTTVPALRSFLPF